MREYTQEIYDGFCNIFQQLALDTPSFAPHKVKHAFYPEYRYLPLMAIAIAKDNAAPTGTQSVSGTTVRARNYASTEDGPYGMPPAGNVSLRVSIFLSGQLIHGSGGRSR